MKKIVLFIISLIIFVFPQVVFGQEVDEVPVILPGDIEAYDDFLDLNDIRWNFTTTDWEVRDNQYGTYLRNNEAGSTGYAYQPYDYNSGNLKSDYYRFITYLDAGDNQIFSGFIISDSLNFDQKNKISVVKDYSYYVKDKKERYNNIQVGLDNVISNEKIKYDNDASYYYEVIMLRTGSTNNFKVTINVYDHKMKLKLTKTDEDVLLNSIYPAYWVNDNKKAFFHEYNAYHIPRETNNVIIDALYQVENVIQVNWSYENYEPEEVKLYFSNDIDFDLEEDLVVNVNNGGQFDIDDAIAESGYFAAVGYDGGVATEILPIKFDYLKPITSFSYVPTATTNRYKFKWNYDDNAQKYYVSYNNNLVWSGTTNTITVSDISNPNLVSIISKRRSSASNDDSVSEEVYASEGNLDPVQNFDGNVISDSVALSWSQYTDATHYILLRNNGIGEYSALKNPLTDNTYFTGTTYVDPLDDSFLRFNYNIKAVVSDKESSLTSPVSLGNKVKNVISDFNDTTSQVEVTWDVITAANRYKVFKSASADMSAATVTEVTSNAFSFAFDKNDKTNKYIQVQAYKLDAENTSNNVYADKTEVYTIDFSRNNAVTGITPTYVANSSDVNMTWNVLSGATAYDVWIGSSSSNLQLISRTTDPIYTYRIKNTDVSKLYFSVQGINPENAFVLAQPVIIDTFTKDKVQNLSVNYDGGTKVAELRWSSLFRANKYKITDGTNTHIVTGDNTVINNVDIGTSFTITGIKVETTEISSAVSAAVEAIDSDFDVEIKRASGVSTKLYGESLEMSVEVDINKIGVNLKDVSLEFNLKNIVEPGTSNVIASYIYPEIISVSVIDSNDVAHTVDYLTTITTGQTINGIMNANGGYSAVIQIKDDVDNFIATGSKIVVMVKTDLRFNDLSGDPDTILHRDGSIPYAQMELPFHIVGQITALENDLGKGTFIQSAARLDVILSYKTSTNPAEVPSTKFQLIDFTFKNKQLIIGE